MLPVDFEGRNKVYTKPEGWGSLCKLKAANHCWKRLLL